ncbi:MAG TPA: hypothetical protein PLD55_04345 [bacterium]|nr:hypothetical protein [bacterium]
MKEDLRKLLIERASKNGVVICEFCKRPTKKPEVHHIYGRKSELFETLIVLCSEYLNKCHDHATAKGQMKLNKIKEINTKYLVEKYGEDEARRMAGGKLFFTTESKLGEKNE